MGLSSDILTLTAANSLLECEYSTLLFLVTESSMDRWSS
jgi:hypothetical protein